MGGAGQGKTSVPASGSRRLINRSLLTATQNLVKACALNPQEEEELAKSQAREMDGVKMGKSRKKTQMKKS